jgi:hypothetical protein
VGVRSGLGDRADQPPVEQHPDRGAFAPVPEMESDMGKYESEALTPLFDLALLPPVVLAEGVHDHYDLTFFGYFVYSADERLREAAAEAVILTAQDYMIDSLSPLVVDFALLIQRVEEFLSAGHSCSFRGGCPLWVGRLNKEI